MGVGEVERRVLAVRSAHEDEEVVERTDLSHCLAADTLACSAVLQASKALQGVVDVEVYVEITQM